MKEAIHQISDFIYISKATGKYKSKKDVVYHHLKYISRTATYELGSKEVILKNVNKYNKRVDSRVLLKFHIAIPRCSKDEAIEWTKRVKEFVKEQLNVKDEYIYLALHYNENNPHIHIALTPVNKDEKALRIDRKKLKEFHNNWKELLKQSNYITKKYENSIYFDRRVEYDEQARKEMKEYRELQAQIYQMKKIQKPAPEQPKPSEPKPSEPKPSSSPNYSQFETKTKSYREEWEEWEREVRERLERERLEREKERKEKLEREKLENVINQKPAPEQPKPPEQKTIEPNPSSFPTYSQFKELKEFKEKEQELNMKISVASERDKKPYPTDFEVKEIKTLKELKDIIRTRFYSNIIWQDGYRSSKNAVSVSNFLVFDVDGTDRIERVEKILKEKNIKSLITTTKSHTENSHHFRVLIKTDRELQESELQYYKHFMKIVADELNINVDKATFDLARMYAPNKNAQFIFIDGKELGIDRYIEEAIKEHDKELMIERARDIKYSNQEQEYWIYVDVSKMIDIDIERLIEHFESVSKRWKEGSQVYVRTSRSNKYGINKIYNVAYNFYEGRGYGVISYLQEQLNTTHLLNIAKYLQDNNISDNLIFINDEVFTQKLNKCLENSHDFDDFIDEVKKEFNVKSVFVDFNSGTIKIGQFTVKLSKDEIDKIARLYINNNGLVI